MLMTLDVGNTHTEIGLFDNKKLNFHWRLETRATRTTDEFALLVNQLFSLNELKFKEVKAIMVSCVVPSQDKAIKMLGRKYFDCDPFFVSSDTVKIKIAIDNSKELGADRLVSAVAAYEKYKTKLIIIDFGTATTFDCIDKDGTYLGGVIAPGIKISNEALFTKTAKLPQVDIFKTETIIGKNTIHCIQSGVYYGYIGLVEYLIDNIKKELEGVEHVIATGGLAGLIAKGTKKIEKVHENLVLEGLNIIYQKRCLDETNI